MTLTDEILNIAGEDYHLRYHKAQGEYWGAIMGIYLPVPPQNTIEELRVAAEGVVNEYNSKQ